MGSLDCRAVTSPRNLRDLENMFTTSQLLELLKIRKTLKQSPLKQDHRQREIPKIYKLDTVSVKGFERLVLSHTGLLHHQVPFQTPDGLPQSDPFSYMW